MLKYTLKFIKFLLIISIGAFFYLFYIGRIDEYVNDWRKKQAIKLENEKKEYQNILYNIKNQKKFKANKKRFDITAPLPKNFKKEVYLYKIKGDETRGHNVMHQYLNLDGSKISKEKEIELMGKLTIISILPLEDIKFKLVNAESVKVKEIIKNNFKNTLNLYKNYKDVINIRFSITQESFKRQFNNDIKKIYKYMEEKYNVKTEIFLVKRASYIISIKDVLGYDDLFLENYFADKKYDINYLKDLKEVYSNSSKFLKEKVDVKNLWFEKK